MKYAVLLGLIALVNFAYCNLYRYEGDEGFGSLVDWLNKTLNSLAATEEGPFLKLVTAYSVKVTVLEAHPNINSHLKGPFFKVAAAYSVDITVLKAYPTVNADLKDKEKKVQRCEVTLYKPLDFEDFTAKDEVNFDCPDYQSIRNVTLPEYGPY